jgi:hypothetical protein
VSLKKTFRISSLLPRTIRKMAAASDAAGGERKKMKRAKWMLRIGILVAVVSVAVNAGVMSASAATRTTGDHAMTQGVKLTPAQIGALRAAYKAHRWLSADQARQLIDRSKGSTPITEGIARSWGYCSYMYLEGYEYGYYNWYNHIQDDMASGQFGEIQISTNGLTAQVSDNWVGGGRDYTLEGNLLWNGWGATGTTMSGWTVLTDGTFCTGSMFAQW